MRKYSRRQFLTGAAGLAAGLSCPFVSAQNAPAPRQAAGTGSPADPTPAPTPPRAPQSSRVVMARDARSVVQFVYNPDIIAAMTERAISSFFGVASASVALSRLVSPGDVVGLKVFSTPGAVKATNKAIVKTVINALRAAGVPAGNIIVWDKFRFDLETAQFLPAFQVEEKIPIMATAPDTGYGEEPFYDFEVTGTLIWGDRDFNAKKASADINADGTGNLQLSTKSYFSRIVTQRCTKLINLASLCDHPDFGINGALVNMAIGSVDNSRRFGVRPYFGVPPIPDIYANPVIKNKVILTLMDALITSYAGGPAFRAEYSAQTGQIFVSTDPVAIDSLCLRQLINLRKTANNIPTAPWFGVHVEAAAEYGLGVAAPTQINLFTV